MSVVRTRTRSARLPGVIEPVRSAYAEIDGPIECRELKQPLQSKRHLQADAVQVTHASKSSPSWMTPSCDAQRRLHGSPRPPSRGSPAIAIVGGRAISGWLAAGVAEALAGRRHHGAQLVAQHS